MKKRSKYWWLSLPTEKLAADIPKQPLECIPKVDAVSLALAADLTPLLVGPPGVAKTSILSRVGDWLGMDLVSLVTSTMEASDFAVPLIDRQTKKVDLVPHPIVREAMEKDVVLFLDEINQAPRGVFAVVMGLITERRVSVFPLKEKTKIVAACNDLSHAAEGRPIPPAVLNRLVVLEDWVLPNEAYERFFAWGTTYTPRKYQRPPKDIFEVGMSKTGQMVAEFMKHHYDRGAAWSTSGRIDNISPGVPTPFQSARAWTWVRQAIVVADFDFDDEALLLVIQGLVGKEIGTLFFNWAREWIESVEGSLRSVWDRILEDGPNTLPVEELAMLTEQLVEGHSVHGEKIWTVALPRAVRSLIDRGKEDIALGLIWSAVQTYHDLNRDQKTPSATQAVADLAKLGVSLEGKHGTP